MNPEFPTDRTPEKHHRAPVFLNNDASVAPVSAAHLVPLSRYAIAGPSWRLSSPRTPASACNSGSSRCSSPSSTSPTTGSPRINSARSTRTSPRVHRRPRRKTRPRWSPPRPPHPCPAPTRPPHLRPRLNRPTRRVPRPGRGRSRPGQEGVGEALGSRRRRRRLDGRGVPARFPPGPRGRHPRGEAPGEPPRRRLRRPGRQVPTLRRRRPVREDAHPRRVRSSVLGVREELEGVPPGFAPRARRGAFTAPEARRRRLRLASQRNLRRPPRVCETRLRGPRPRRRFPRREQPDELLPRPAGALRHQRWRVRRREGRGTPG